jgi:tetratricopeptide (TPR) repeat protein
MNAKSISLRVCIAIAAATLFAACSGSENTDTGNPTATQNAAVDMFWRALHNNDYAHIGDAQAALRAAIDQNPNSAELYALVGATHWWHAGEASRDSRPDPNVLSTDLPTALQLLQRAAQLDPNEDHYPGFIGTTTVHIGRAAGDPNMIAQGDQMLEYAVYQFPEFNNFNRWAAHNSDPKNSDSYREALDALWKAVDACAGVVVDRGNPDLTPYLHLQTKVGRKKVCWDNDLAPHGFEGLMLNLGNGLVKVGAVEVAMVAFRNAQLMTSYSSWPYRGVLETLLASDLHARAALYSDGDSRNDPPVTVPGRSCVYCHATVPEPTN